MGKRSFPVRQSRSTVSLLRVACLGAALVGAIAFTPISRAADANSGNWVGSWTAPAQPVWTADFPVPLGLPSSLWKQTIRQTARLSIGGNRVRIVLSNEYGKTPLNIGVAHIALAADLRGNPPDGGVIEEDRFDGDLGEICEIVESADVGQLVGENRFGVVNRQLIEHCNGNDDDWAKDSKDGGNIEPG